MMVMLVSEPVTQSVRASTKAPSFTPDRKSTRLNSSHSQISYAVFCLKQKKIPAFEARPGDHRGYADADRWSAVGRPALLFPQRQDTSPNMLGGLKCFSSSLSVNGTS